MSILSSNIKEESSEMDKTCDCDMPVEKVVFSTSDVRNNM